MQAFAFTCSAVGTLKPKTVVATFDVHILLTMRTSDDQEDQDSNMPFKFLDLLML